MTIKYNIDIISELDKEKVDAVILAVAHEKFRDFNITSLVKVNHVIFDVKGAVDPNFIDGRL